MTFHMPDGWYEPPEPSASDVLEEAEWIADNFVAEWADLGEWEVWIDVTVTRANEPVYSVTRVAHDGEVHFGGPSGDIREFEDESELRDWLTERFPFPKDEEEF